MSAAFCGDIHQRRKAVLFRLPRASSRLAHLARHEKGLKAGDRVMKGQRLGEVGATGHVVGGPHLHFAIFRDEDAAGRALVVNPYLVFSPIVLGP